MILLWLIVFFCGFGKIACGDFYCSAPDSISHGAATYSTLNLGDSVTYECDPEHVLQGSAVRYCVSGFVWNGTLPNCIHVDELFDFTCDMAGNIRVANPDPSAFQFAYAFNQNKVCTVAWDTPSYAFLNITGCALDKMIRLILSPNSMPVVVTTRVQFYNITCLQLDTIGILQNVTDKTHVRIWYQSRFFGKAANVTVRDEVIGLPGTPAPNGTGLNATALVNDAMQWRVYTNEGFIVQVVNCTATSGYIASMSGYRTADLIDGGCSEELRLMTDFKYNLTVGRHETFASFIAFRFKESHEMRWLCNIRVCPPSSSVCDYDCSRRKKRSDWKPDDQLSRPYPMSGGYPKSGNSDEETMESTISFSMWVDGPPTFGFEASDPNRARLYTYSKSCVTTFSAVGLAVMLVLNLLFMLTNI